MTLLPPPQYDVPPPVPVIEHVLSYSEVERLCTSITGLSLSPGQRIYGCAKMIAGSCHIVMVDDAVVRRHEMAHCAGWPKEHPGGW